MGYSWFFHGSFMVFHAITQIIFMVYTMNQTMENPWKYHENPPENHTFHNPWKILKFIKTHEYTIKICPMVMIPFNGFFRVMKIPLIWLSGFMEQFLWVFQCFIGIHGPWKVHDFPLKGVDLIRQCNWHYYTVI